MKKQTRLFIIVVVVLILTVGVAQYILSNQTNFKLTDFQKRNLSEVSETVVSPKETVKAENVSIDFGNGQKMTGQVSTQSAYQALVKVSKDNSLNVLVKQYKYGVMVEKVGEAANSKNSAWMYWVNGKPGQIASDRYIIYPGDKVEWKFSKF